MTTFLLCFLTGSFGAIAGFLLSSWVRKLPEHTPDHRHCQERFDRMVRDYRHQIRDQESEIQRLIQGLS